MTAAPKLLIAALAALVGYLAVGQFLGGSDGPGPADGLRAREMALVQADLPFGAAQLAETDMAIPGADGGFRRDFSCTGCVLGTSAPISVSSAVLLLPDADAAREAMGFLRDGAAQNTIDSGFDTAANGLATSDGTTIVEVDGIGDDASIVEVRFTGLGVVKGSSVIGIVRIRHAVTMVAIAGLGDGVRGDDIRGLMRRATARVRGEPA
jgi:hypothetical protein